MAEENLNLAGITSKCEYLRDAIYPYYEQLREAFIILFLSGLRIEELFEIDRWEWIENYDFHLQPQKGNNMRLITLSNNCEEFKSAVIGQYTPFQGITVSKLKNLFNKIKEWNYFQTGEKKFSFYIFRYRFVKQLQADGFTVSQIATLMGYTSNSTPQAYLDATIVENFNTPPIPEVTIGGQTWMLNYLSVDDGLGGIDYVNNDPSSVDDFGLLYTHESAVRCSQLVDSYRLPTKDDFEILKIYLGGLTVAGGKMKCVEFDFFMSPNTGATNSSVFSGKAGGLRFFNQFQSFREASYMWTITTFATNDYWFYYLVHTDAHLKCNHNSFPFRLQVRLIKNVV